MDLLRAPYSIALRRRGASRLGVDHVVVETVVGTDEDQTAVAPGALRRTWTEGGRRYFHYVTDAPIGNEYAVFSANYAVREEEWTGPGQQVVDPNLPSPGSHAESGPHGREARKRR